MKVRLGELLFDAEARQLLRNGAEVHLSPKAFELLKTLIEESPRALSKSELHERLWPSTFVSDVNLSTLVAEIRDALGDSARQPRFIRTVHRFGYAFCGPAAGEESMKPEAAACFCWLIKDGRRLPLHDGENVLGRDADAIVLESPTVSRRHARIQIVGGVATIEDLQSKNGTFVAGKRVAAPTPLANGDEIRAGSVVLHFRMATPARMTSTWSQPADA